jgi:GR25 family glycosyltransferase involved in LPS biosynthesis
MAVTTKIKNGFISFVEESRQKQVIKLVKKYNVKVVNILNDNNSEINKRIQKIYVINLAEDIYKRNYIITLMKKYNINFTLVIVERISQEVFYEFCKKSTISKEEFGCCLSHLWCLYQIILNKFTNAIVFEDDIILHKDFEQKIIDICDNIPNIDFLLLGAHDFNFSTLNYTKVKDTMYKPSVNKGNHYSNIYGAHANLYSLKAAKRMFNIRTTQIDFFDSEYMLMFNYLPSSYICFPNLVLSNISESNLGHDRTILSNSEQDYYNKCFIKLNFTKYNYIYIHLLKYITFINDDDTYETLTDRYLSDSVDSENVQTIKKRIVMDFFTKNDIINILTT